MDDPGTDDLQGLVRTGVKVIAIKDLLRRLYPTIQTRAPTGEDACAVRAVGGREHVVPRSVIRGILAMTVPRGMDYAHDYLAESGLNADDFMLPAPRSGALAAGRH